MESLIVSLIVLIIAFFVIWAIWGKIPWKTVGKVVLTIIVIATALAIINSMVCK
jgi:hypothetical protein